MVSSTLSPAVHILGLIITSDWAVGPKGKMTVTNERGSVGVSLEPVGRGSKPACKVLEPAERVLESAKRAAEPAGKASEPAGRATEPAWRGGQTDGRKRKRKRRKSPYVVMP